MDKFSGNRVYSNQIVLDILRIRKESNGTFCEEIGREIDAVYTFEYYSINQPAIPTFDSNLRLVRPF